jgi:hypothetical protein
MTPEEAIKIVENYIGDHLRLEAGCELALCKLLDVARECLARRKEPSIAEVLDEVITELMKPDYTMPVAMWRLKQIRAKYCPSPDKEELAIAGPNKARCWEEFIKWHYTAFGSMPAAKHWMTINNKIAELEEKYCSDSEPKPEKPTVEMVLEKLIRMTRDRSLDSGEHVEYDNMLDRLREVE